MHSDTGDTRRRSPVQLHTKVLLYYTLGHRALGFVLQGSSISDFKLPQGRLARQDAWYTRGRFLCFYSAKRGFPVEHSPPPSPPGACSPHAVSLGVFSGAFSSCFFGVGGEEGNGGGSVGGKCPSTSATSRYSSRTLPASWFISCATLDIMDRAAAFAIRASAGIRHSFVPIFFWQELSSDNRTSRSVRSSPFLLLILLPPSSFLTYSITSSVSRLCVESYIRTLSTRRNIFPATMFFAKSR